MVPSANFGEEFGLGRGKKGEQWKQSGCLGYIGDEFLPSYVGIIS